MKRFLSLSNNWLWVILGALYGLALRLLVVWHKLDIDGAMSVTFLIATPIAAGAITIFGQRGNTVPVVRMIFLPWLTITMMMLGAAVTLLEGSICIALMSPLFLALASVGGLIMGFILRFTQKRNPPVAAFALLPFLVATAEPHIPQTPHLIEVKRSVTVSAPPAAIWHEIVSAKHIQPQELPLSLSHSIGVPKPIEGVNKMVDGKEIRYSIWERGVNFEAEVLEKSYPNYIRWQYKFDEHSFPKGSMDDHVAIGGKHFNLQDTAFSLTSITKNKTQLTLTAHYRVSSSINFYALPLSKILGIDFVDTLLGFYKLRSEKSFSMSEG